MDLNQHSWLVQRVDPSIPLRGRPWVAGPCLLCVILLETVDGVLMMYSKCTQENGREDAHKQDTL
jgi:hypothetical protein